MSVPKYKVCKRFGATIFEKCQTTKYTLSVSKQKNIRKGRRPRGLSDFGRQMLEKQKMRLTYGLREKQFVNYVREAVEKKGEDTAQTLFALVEKRLDNAVYRLGFAHTRALARQLVSHGHITVNGDRTTIPSRQLREGDVIAIREGSKKKTVFENLESRLKEYNAPAWLKFDYKTLTGTVQGKPTFVAGDLLFDLQAIIEFYSR